jgi:hypothetical protein
MAAAPNHLETQKNSKDEEEFILKDVEKPSKSVISKPKLKRR